MPISKIMFILASDECNLTFDPNIRVEPKPLFLRRIEFKLKFSLNISTWGITDFVVLIMTSILASDLINLTFDLSDVDCVKTNTF